MMVVLLAAGATGEGALAEVLLALAALLIGAKLAGEITARLGQPAVLGEVGFGVLLAALAPRLGLDLEPLVHGETFTVLAELGAILLLFHVGLESTPREMMAVGGRATAVAVVGVVTPMLLGFGLGEIMHPRESWMLHAFLGAMLSATSVGITARVLKDAGAVRAPFARIILGAAVIDDVLALLLLAVVSGVIQAAASGQAMTMGAVGAIVVKAFLFLAGALVAGSLLSPRVFKTALRLRSSGLVQTLSLGLCFLFSWLALLAGLAPIVGAFAAGLVLEEIHFKSHVERGDKPLHETLEPLIALLVPIFFVRMGLLVDVGSFASWSVLGFAALLTLAAVIGKLACAVAVPKGLPGLTIGLGMMPRGEVGLIFAGIGAQLVLDGHPIVDPGTYAAAVFMVLVTTMATPPLLLWSLQRNPSAVA